MICLLSQPARIDKLEPTDPPDYRARTTSAAATRGLAAQQMAEVSSMVSSLPMGGGAMGDVYYPWRSALAAPYEEEFLGAAIGQKRHRVEETTGEFSYALAAGASSTYSSSPTARASRDSLGSSRTVDVSWAPLDEIVKKATERSYQSSPSYTQETYSSDSGKHSDVSKHFSPPRNEGNVRSSAHPSCIPIDRTEFGYNCLPILAGLANFVCASSELARELEGRRVSWNWWSWRRQFGGSWRL
jgi:hypothetical protein